MEKNWLDWVAFILVILGAINWGLVGLFQLDLVKAIFDSVAWLANIIYILIGLAGLYLIYLLSKEK